MDLLKDAESDWNVVCSCPSDIGRLTVPMTILILLWPYFELKRNVSEERIEMPPKRTDEDPIIGKLVERIPNGEAVQAWLEHCLARLSPDHPLGGDTTKRPMGDAIDSRRYMYLLLFAAYLQSQGLKPIPQFA